MALMTEEERRRLVPKGLYVKTKCDICGNPIMSCLTYTGPNGEDCCSRICLRRLESKLSGRDFEPHKENKMSKEKVEKTPKSGKPKSSKNKAEMPSKDKKLKAKAKKRVRDDEDDEEEAPKKKSSKSLDGKKKAKKAHTSEPAEKKGKVSGNGANPYSRPSSVVYQVFEMAKEGTTVKAINKFLKENDTAPARVWRELRSGEFRGMRWKYTESESGKVTVQIRTKKD